jgi:hypothetical protein
MKSCIATLGLGVVLAMMGCQTQWAGTTLPSGRYLEHPAQFIPTDPDFPLSNELAYQESVAAVGLPGGPAGPPAAPRAVPPRP